MTFDDMRKITKRMGEPKTYGFPDAEPVLKFSWSSQKTKDAAIGKIGRDHVADSGPCDDNGRFWAYFRELRPSHAHARDGK